MQATEAAVDQVARSFRPPKEERLRVLLLGSAAAGDLRVGREQSESAPRLSRRSIATSSNSTFGPQRQLLTFSTESRSSVRTSSTSAVTATRGSSS